MKWVPRVSKYETMKSLSAGKNVQAVYVHIFAVHKWYEVLFHATLII